MAEPNPSSEPPTGFGTAVLDVQTSIDSVVPAHERLIELSRLPANWDSYDADPPTPAAIATAAALIAAVDEDRLRLTGQHTQPWMIAPVPDGGVQVEWMASPRKIEVFIDPAGGMHYLIIDRSHAVPEYTEVHDVDFAHVRSSIDSILAG
jgi:hypothetical protein